MPNFKVFQDNPDQARIKIFGSDNAIPVFTDSSGFVGITATGLAVSGTVTVTTGSGSLNVCITQGITVTTGSGSLSVCIPESISVTTGSGSLSVCIPASVAVTTGSGSLDVCITQGITVTTGSGLLGISLDGRSTTDLSENVSTASTSYSGATAEVVLNQTAWTFAVKNTSLEANAQAVVQVQMSATALTESDWLQEVSPVTLNQNSLAFLTTSLLLKYARVYYAAVNAASQVTLNVIFQAQK